VVTSTVETAPALRRAVLFMTASSFLMPAAGLLTAPILARALSADGRGELAAALAPAALMLGAATLGLPDALTYFLAKNPRITRPALLYTSLVTVVVGLVCLTGTLASLSFISAGDPALGRLILLATALTIPSLILNVFRGAAIGHQMWTAVALERLIQTTLRVVGFGMLFIMGDLTVIAAVLVSCAIPMMGGVVYWPLLRPRGSRADTAPSADVEPRASEMFSSMMFYGSRVWLGGVASMLLNRVNQLLMTPLSSVQDLGIFTVASTVADLPLVVAWSVQGALFGVSSRAKDAAQVTATSRLTLLVALVGCTLIGISLPFWIEPLFGPEFGAATVPGILLLVGALACIPGLSASTGLAAWNRPGLRSMGLAFTLVINVVVLVLLVPPLGATGAALTNIVSNLVMSTFMVLAARRVMKVPARKFFAIGRHDLSFAASEGLRALRRLRRNST
jgi:O-antigen/teichoic acid export membrane protein